MDTIFIIMTLNLTQNKYFIPKEYNITKSGEYVINVGIKEQLT